MYRSNHEQSTFTQQKKSSESRHQLTGLHRYHVAAGSAADGSAIADLPCGESAWVSLVIRGGVLLPVGGDTLLRADDDVLILAEPDEAAALQGCFTIPAPAGESTAINDKEG